MTAYVHQEFPKAIYHPSGRVKHVHSAEELETLLGQDWGEAPFPPEPQPEPDLPACERCVKMQAKFEAAWQRITEEKRALKDQNEKMALALEGKGAKKKAAPKDDAA